LRARRVVSYAQTSVPMPEREFALLRALGIFAPLPIATLETLASAGRSGSAG
jgi:hypothetical protein